MENIIGKTIFKSSIEMFLNKHLMGFHQVKVEMIKYRNQMYTHLGKFIKQFMFEWPNKNSVYSWGVYSTRFSSRHFGSLNVALKWYKICIHTVKRGHFSSASTFRVWREKRFGYVVRFGFHCRRIVSIFTPKHFWVCTKGKRNSIFLSGEQICDIEKAME